MSGDTVNEAFKGGPGPDGEKVFDLGCVERWNKDRQLAMSAMEEWY